MSCAMRRSPRGSIQRPKRGKKLKMPPRMSPPATMIRIQSLDGSRSQRMKVPTFVGTERSINVKYLFSPTVTEAMPNPIRVSVKEPHRKMLLGTKPAGGEVFPGRGWDRLSRLRQPSDFTRDAPSNKSRSGVTPNGFSSRLPVSWFCRPTQAASSPLCSPRRPAVS